MADSASHCDDDDPVESLLAQHRKEKKALKGDSAGLGGVQWRETSRCISSSRPVTTTPVSVDAEATGLEAACSAKKALSMKKVAKSGNKQKQKETNAEVERLERELTARHERELAELKAQTTNCSSSPVRQAPLEQPEVDTDELETAFYKQVTVSTRNKKKQAKQEEAIRRMQEAVALDRQNAETSLRVTEMAAIQKILDERGLNIVDIAPDGDCLYNAVAHQLSRVRGFEQVTGKDMRRKAAKYIREHKDDFIPFLVNESDDPLDEFEFEKYCHGVENESKDGGVWGGEPELNALSQSLERSIELIQPIGSPVIFGEQFNKTKPLIIVYHRHAYQLGAHYNSTAVRTIS